MALNLAVLPVVAGLMAGTGAMAAYMVAPTAAPAPVSGAVQIAAPKSKPCEAQTWPYLDNRCVAANAGEIRKVRLVMAPRDGVADGPASDTAAAAPAPVNTPSPGAALDNLVTHDAVGRPDSAAAAAPVSRRSEKRRVRPERRLARQAYQVPSEASGGRDSRPVIVVRPLRLDFFR